MLVEDTGRIFVPIFDPRYETEWKDFLVSCCEPVCRTQYMNEYAITKSSLSAAASEGTYNIATIRRILRSICTVYAQPQRPESDELQLEELHEEDMVIPAAVRRLLYEEERSERLQLVLQPELGARGAKSSSSSAPLRYYLQCGDKEYLESVVQEVQHLLQPTSVGGALGERWMVSDLEEIALGDLHSSGFHHHAHNHSSSHSKQPEKRGRDDDEGDDVNELQAAIRARRSGLLTTVRKTVVFKSVVRDEKLLQLREALDNRGVRVQCSYDYANDKITPVVENLSLKLGVRLRPYQEVSLERFQRGKKAHNGIVVLPCGAGKTLTGIAASTIVQRRVIVMCCNVMSVKQWRDEFLKWTRLHERQVTICVSGEKADPGDVFITTYSMLTKKRPDDIPKEQTSDAKRTDDILAAIKSTTWGLLLLDEVHMAPADKFREVINCVRHHCVVGLSATLLREDEKIGNLNYLVGPKLYEANWLELTEKGYLADVVCVDVRCPMPPALLQHYLAPSANDQMVKLATTINPYKLWTTQALLRYHLQQQSPPDKVIIFCDAVSAVEHFAHTLGLPYMDGKTSQTERDLLLRYFKETNVINALILSRVGDIALDIPQASVIIQLSGLGASRRQEAQRLGRILRMKPDGSDATKAYFYTLVSEDTDETSNAFGRQQWLKDQGFAYRMVRCKEILSSLDLAHRICVGPPQWYWKSEGHEPPCLFDHYSVPVAYRHPDATAEHAAHHSSSHRRFIPFTFNESRKVDINFQKGCASGVMLLGTHRDEHDSFPSWDQLPPNSGDDNHWELSSIRCCFESADAPHTFGTVTFVVKHTGKGGKGLRHAMLRRRIAKHVNREHAVSISGSTDSHDCVYSDECISHLLTVSKGGH